MTASDFRAGKLLRIFLDEQDRSGAQPAYTAIVEFLRKQGVSGATVFRGIEGFGGHNQMHVARVFSWSANLPILIEVVDDWSVLEPLLPRLEAMLGEGLMTIEAAQYLRLVKEKGGTASAGP
jgi:PII-like signaling protein